MNIQLIKVSTLILVAVGNMSLAHATQKNINVDLDSITYLEEEENTSLNFDTEAFLPADFNPYAAPANFQHNSYIDEEQKTVELGFDTQDYLPEGFNPHSFFFDIHSIEYIEENDLIELDFDTKEYLPSNFNAGISI